MNLCGAYQLDLRLLDRIERGGLVEVFDLFLPARTDHLGSPHVPRCLCELWCTG